MWLGRAAIVSGLSLLLVAFLVNHQSNTLQTESRLLAAARRCGVDPKQGVTGIVPALAWTRAARTWRLHPSVWRSPLLEQRILLGWPCAEIEAAWLEEVATPLAKQIYGQSVDALSDREVAGLLMGLQTPGAIQLGALQRRPACRIDPQCAAHRRGGPPRWLGAVVQQLTTAVNNVFSLCSSIEAERATR